MTSFDEKTTDLDIIRKHPQKYTWGKIIKIHDISRYTIVEHYLPDNICFTIYVDGKDTNFFSCSLDRAIITAVAMGYNEINEARHLARHAIKMMDIP